MSCEVAQCGWRMNTADKPLKWVLLGECIKTGVCSPCASKCMRAEVLKILMELWLPLIHRPHSSFRREARCNSFPLQGTLWSSFQCQPWPRWRATVRSWRQKGSCENQQLCSVHWRWRLDGALTKTSHRHDVGVIVQWGQRYLLTLHWGGSHARESHFCFYHFISDVQVKAILVTLQKKVRTPLITRINSKGCYQTLLKSTVKIRK